MKRCLAIAFAVLGMFAPAVSAATYKLPPTGQDQWYWEISPPADGLQGLPSVTGAYPSPGSANIWDTDMFADSNNHGGVPTGPSAVVQALHAAGKYTICYIEVGAQQTEPDSSNFASADYTDGSNPQTTEMQGWPGEYWYDIRGFANYVAGDASTLTGAAVNIAAGLASRIEDCAIEGQDGVEPDDLDGYTNPSQTGAPGGGWGLTQADSAGFERWLAYTAHSDGLAIFQKNDPANAGVDEPLFDGMIIEECNYYNDPCAGAGGDATPYLNAGKPVLGAEYTEDGETTAKFCPADTASGIIGALFDVNLDGKTYQPCAPVGTTTSGGTGNSGNGAPNSTNGLAVVLRNPAGGTSSASTKHTGKSGGSRCKRSSGRRRPRKCMRAKRGARRHKASKKHSRRKTTLKDR